MGKTSRYIGLAMAGLIGCVGTAQAAPVLKTTAYLRFATMSPFSPGTNYFDPANGYVPSCTSNSAGITVPVNGNIEFGFDDGVNLDTVNFVNGTSLVVKDITSNGAYPFRFTVFTNRAHFFDNLALTLNEFGARYRVNDRGNALTFVSPTLIPSGSQTRTAIFTFLGTGSPAAAPEPLTWAMMVMGFGAVGAMMRRARSRWTVRLSYAA